MSGRGTRPTTALVVAVILTVAAGCDGGSRSADRAATSAPAGAAPGTAAAEGPRTAGPHPPVAAPPSAPAPAPPLGPAPVPAGPDGAAANVAPRLALSRIAVADGPGPGGYRRDEWPHWVDLDGDGCDARQQVLLASSEEAIAPDRSCAVTTGRWTSPYDGVVVTAAQDLDVDHLVPLAGAHRSGGHRWSTDLRTTFANDPANLLAVSASSNRSKGDKGPDRWRPPRREVWCDYATRWVRVKVAYRLAATTSERDALGQMLDTCS